jgi:regulator of sigma E protease
MTLILFFAVLFVLILVHEWGHFITAKKTGMRVDEFGIGFPPKLFGVKKGETEYTFNALPIGGFVRIFGEDAEGARQSSDYERSFVAKPKWAQAVVLMAGVIMNVVFAWFLFVVVFLIGVPTVVDENEASDSARVLITNVLPDSPAGAALIAPGSVLVSLASGDDVLTEVTPAKVREFTERVGDADITVTYLLNTEEKSAVIRPVQGLDTENTERFAIGIATALVETKSEPIHTAIIRASTATYDALIAITVGIYTLLADAFLLQADFSQVAGPVGIVGMVGDAAAFGLTSLLLFTATISLNLAVVNLLPFPALDGGRLVMVAIESVTRRPINPKWVLSLNTIGFILLLLLMVAVTYNDIVKLL